MTYAQTLEEYVAALLTGDRMLCRDFIARQLSVAVDIPVLYSELLWPAMERLEKLYRADRINMATEHLAVRISRSIADQVQASLLMAPRNNRKIVVACAPDEREELGAQMCADLFEARGWKVYFLGGGVPNDEVHALLGQICPDCFLIFGAQPSGVPEIRKLVDMIRDIGVNETMNVIVSGGVFNRADALWREVNADIFARNAEEAIVLAEETPPRKPTARVSGVPKKRRRRRRVPMAPAGS